MAFEITAKIEAALKKLCDLNGDGQITTNAKDSYGKCYNEVSIFNVAKSNLIKNGHCTIYNKSYELVDDVLKETNNLFSMQKSEFPLQNDILHNETIIEIPKKPKEVKSKTKEEIVSKMCEKWSKKFGSPLKEDFYNHLWDVIDTLNCSINEKDYKKYDYSSMKEQTMDEVIAIFAREARLDPKCKSNTLPIYYGLFQLAKLDSIKAWALKHPEVKGMENIDQKMTIERYRNEVSGEKQLDYLVAFIGKSRDVLKIPDKTITPAQLWAMIKLPHRGGDDPVQIEKKAKAIKSTFIKNKIEYGTDF